MRCALEARNEAPRHDHAERRDFGHFRLMHEDVRPPEGDLRARAEDQCERRADLEVAFDEGTGDFGYAEPEGGRALLELAPTPSWRALQFRR